MSIARAVARSIAGPIAKSLPGLASVVFGGNGEWVLATGFWVDEGTWLDAESWID